MPGRNLFAIVNQQPRVRRVLYRISVFVITALLAVAIKSPQAVAQSAAFSRGSQRNTVASADNSMINGAAAAGARAGTVISVNDARSLRDQSVDDRFPISTNVQPLRISTQLHTRTIIGRLQPIVKLVGDLPPGAHKVLRQGMPAITLVTERVTSWNGIVVDDQIVGKRVTQHARAAEIAAGPPRNVSEALALTKFRKFVGVFAMIATAYTAGSAQSMPTGRTATGQLARYGVVAVDPRIIPLGAHLFIPGYGTAIAADTGGSIIGNRIDLCMDSLQAAMSFGRQSVKVYVLGQ